MHIVIFIHPDFKNSQSMPKFANMIAAGMSERNHLVEMWTTRGFLFKIPSPAFVKKWLGYIDQFIIFPIQVKKKLKKCASHTLFVFADRALGPWVPLLQDRPHVIHCHDFMAQRSALGEVPQNKVGLLGRLYQAYIRKGYRSGKNFISISEKTRQDLHRFLKISPAVSEVVYNGLNLDFRPGERQPARQTLQEITGVDLEKGYVLHVGGDLFYKNREGVFEIYDAWRDRQEGKLPLVFVGARPGKDLEILIKKSRFSGQIHFLENVTDEVLKLAYHGASVLLYPSIDEGFGWPIAEALASGCPVITTNKAPMNEVGGPACLYLPCKTELENPEIWTAQSAKILESFFDLSEKELEELIKSGLIQAKKFSTVLSLEKIEKIYEDILLQSTAVASTPNIQQSI